MSRSAEPQVDWQASYPFLFKTHRAANSHRPLRAIVLRIFGPISIKGACPEISEAMAYWADRRASFRIRSVMSRTYAVKTGLPFTRYGVMASSTSNLEI